ncbi:MAG: Fe-S cluster assembly protein SufD [Woeseiaceae bacterium]|nr:Fe-S cluster assembly protein SufD [Woeseiaceae bacterium]
MTTQVIDKSLLDAAVKAMPDDRLAGLRREAADRFVSLGFPGTDHEDWKYTNLSDIEALSVAWLKGNPNLQPVSSVTDITDEVRSAIDAHWLLVRDGVADDMLPDIDGIEIERLVDADCSALSADDALSAFNVALLQDGLRIRVEPDAAPDRPLAILNIDSARQRVVQSRLVVELAAGARLELIECALSNGSGSQFTNSVVDVDLENAACLTHTRVQDRHPDHSGIYRLQASLARDANIRHSSFDFGGALSRNDVVTDIKGTGAAVGLNGLYLAGGEQHIDNHTSIIHGVGPATSDEEYRGILTGRAQCVFNGKVIVAEGADGTNSRQSNHNLLLSDRAEIDTKPELEIYADDVKCAHGATVGQLDHAALFYLQSRGLDRDQAKQILTRAFAAGMLSSLSVPACEDFVSARLDRRLAELVDDVDD